MKKIKSHLSLREQIGQMLLIGFEGKQIHSDSDIVKHIEKNNIGGVVLFDYNARSQSYDKNIESPVQVKKLNEDLQLYTQQSNQKYNRPTLPLLIAVDYEGGAVTRLNDCYGFPKTYCAEEIGKKTIQDAEYIAQGMAKTLSESGFNLNFAPVLDVNVNVDNPIIGKKRRSFSSDAERVGHYARVFSKQFLKQNIQCVYKHFPGHGSSTLDSHLDFVDVTETWQDSELIPYEQLLKIPDSCNMIMTAHIVNRKLDDSGYPATLSHKMLTQLLRNQLSFSGVIVSDDMQMNAIYNHYGLEQALELAINAGVDMLTFGNNLSACSQNPENLIDIIENHVSTGKIKKERINEAYLRIINFKQCY